MKKEALIAALALLCGACQPAGTSLAEADTPLSANPAPTQNAAKVQHEVENKEEFIAQGNEPFWRIATRGSSMEYSSPEHLGGVELPAERSMAGEWHRFAAGFEGEKMILDVRRGQCFDDMSGLEFSHVARFSWQGGIWTGCARLSIEPQPIEISE